MLLRPGFVLGDTSLVTYFNLRDDDKSWSSWKVTLYDADSGTEQASSSLTKEDLEKAVCDTARKYCRSFGAADGWVVNPAKEYFATITAVFADGRQVVSAPSEKAKPRSTIVPPPVSNKQAAGCGCGNALGTTASTQAVRAIGVNTGTGAFSRVERDLTMASFGIPFASVRTYSSANPTAGPFGAGWAWSYGMQVTASNEGAVVRAEDGAEALYKLVDGAYQRPAGVRSTLKKVGDGWELVTPRQITHTFDAQGRLTSIVNARKVGVRLAYTKYGLTITDASGREVKVKIESGLVRHMTLPDHRSVSFYYEGARLTLVKDARHNSWKYRYSPVGLLTEVINPEKITDLRNEYDASGRVVRQQDALGNATTFAWDASKQEARTTDPDGVAVYDGYRGNVLVYTQHQTGDANNHRYDRTLNRNLVVNGKHNQHESGFDSSGNRISQTAPQPLKFGEKTKYDSRNNPLEHVDGKGNVWKDTYNEFNELVESEDAEKHKIKYTYDERGLLTTRTDQRGKVTRYEYFPSGHENSGMPRAIVSPEGRRTEFSYDETGRRIAVVDPRETVPGAHRHAYTTRYQFDEQDRGTAVHQPGKHHAWRTVYDEVGRTKAKVTPTHATTQYKYFDNGLLRAVIDPRKETKFTYTAAGRKASARVVMDRGPDLVTTYKYDAKGLLHQVTSPRGNVPGESTPANFTSTYFYDRNDNPIRVSRPYPGGKTVARDISVDALDRTEARTDEAGKKSKFERDNTGNVTSTTDTLGRTTELSYDRNGRQKSITDKGGKSTKFEYDEAGNKIKAVSATGGVTTWTYDDDGLLSSATEPRGNVQGADKERFTTHYEYDLAGNPRKVIDSLDHTTVYRYDANNRLTAVTDAKDRTTQYTHREDDRLRTVHNPDAPSLPLFPEHGSTVYEYAEDGLVTAVRDPNGHKTRLDYDNAGRATRKTDPLGRRAEFAYDAEGNRLSTITIRPFEHPDSEERAERTIVDTYDIVGRRERRKLGTDGPVYTWGYDLKDRTTSYGDPAGVREVKYDDEDQIEEVTRTEPGRPVERFGYGYDKRGNITSRSYPDGTKIGAEYDDDSQLTELTASGGSAGVTPSTWKFGYDVAGRRTSTTLPAATGLIEQRSYDDAGRLVKIGTTRTKPAEAPEQPQDPVSAFQLDLDEVGNPSRVVTTRGGVSESVAYGYDEVDRVTSACYAASSCKGHAAGRIDYSYDLVGNRKTQKRTGSAGSDFTYYHHDAADQLTTEVVKAGLSSRVVDYDYDRNGNQTKAGGDRFEYNLDNSLAKATVSGQTSTFGYDATGLRLSAKTGEGAEATTRRWSWDVNGTLPQIAVDTLTNAGGQTVEKRAFNYGPDDEPLALLDPSTGAHAYTHDWLGGVANMLSPTGAAEQAYDYDPFGNPREGTTLKKPELPGGAAKPEEKRAAGPANPMQYTGAYQDSTTGKGNYYLRARNYNPGTGRFGSTDPMPQGGAATSPYAYADNNPVAYTDPTGAMPDAGPTTSSTPAPEANQGPSAEDIAKAQQIQGKSVLDVVLEAGGDIIMEFLGINDLLKCLKGDIGACVMTVVGALPWGKIFKAKKIGEAIWRAGKAVFTFFKEIDWARAILRGAEKAAEAAKAAAAAAAKAAAEKAAAAKAAAEAAAKKAAAAAAERAKALAMKAKAKTKKGAGCADSFVAGTLVLLADGTRKPIEKLQPGDRVLATEPVRARTAHRQVTHKIRTDNDKKFVDVTVKTADGADKITTTDHHPFWSATRKRWIDAGDLKPGELLRTAAGTYVQIGAIRHYQAKQRTYNLTVDTTHTYYVVAGTTPVLVHNACGTAPPGHAYRGGLYKELKDPATRRNVPGTEIHHMPADAAMGLGRRGPSIQMDASDHALTASYGRGAGPDAYRAVQKSLIGNDDVIGAIRMDIYDIQTKFGHKYDDAIYEMLDRFYGPGR